MSTHSNTISDKRSKNCNSIRYLDAKTSEIGELESYQQLRAARKKITKFHSSESLIAQHYNILLIISVETEWKQHFECKNFNCACWNLLLRLQIQEEMYELSAYYGIKMIHSLRAILALYAFNFSAPYLSHDWNVYLQASIQIADGPSTPKA